MTIAPLLALLLYGTAAVQEHPPAAGDTRTVGAGAGAGAGDTLRPTAGSRIAGQRRTTRLMGAGIRGYLSSRGLPPRAGEFVVTDTGLVFRGDDTVVETYPLVGPVRTVAGRPWRASTVSLAYLDESDGRTLYVFRLDAGVFQTDRPGALLDIADRQTWVDSAASREWSADPPLVPSGDPEAAAAVTRRIATGTYADTLYALFGRPARAIGRVGSRGRKAGRLGEYLAARDSLALDPARMTSEAQLRHTLAHELGHRWQARAAAQLGTLWREVPPIRDTRRYGHDSATEHQAEAIAFAVHFLQATAAATAGFDYASLLEQYELMVPGTGLVARYLALQPIYARHPLHAALTLGRPFQSGP